MVSGFFVEIEKEGIAIWASPYSYNIKIIN
jgi:hypothetical protein